MKNGHLLGKKMFENNVSNLLFLFVPVDYVVLLFNCFYHLFVTTRVNKISLGN